MADFTPSQWGHEVPSALHNTPCRELQTINPRWDDERLYQESRRILNAEYQHILYNEFLPTLLGPTGVQENIGIKTLTRGFSRDYQDTFDSRLMNEFATAAYRVGHTLIPGLINMYSTVKSRLQASLYAYSYAWCNVPDQ